MDDAPKPPPADDPAARFRKPGDSPAPAAAPAPKASPHPQSLLRLLEETLTAPLRLGGLFDELALEPAPGYGSLTMNLAVYWAAMLGLNLLHVAIVKPQSLNYPPEMLAIVGAAALFAVFAGGFLLAGAVEAAALASGASSDYARSFQIVSLLSALAPLQAALNWFPAAWPLPLLWGAFACAVALERLHAAPRVAARVTMALLATAGLFTVYTARAAVERALARGEAIEQSASQLRDIAAQVQQLQQTSQLAATATGQPQAGTSSLDLLRPAGANGAMSPQQTQQIQQMQQSAAAMLKSVQPMLNDPNVAKNLTPQQAEMMKQMSGLLTQIQGSLQTGQKLDPAAINALVANLGKAAPGLAQQQAQINQVMAQMQGKGGSMSQTDKEKFTQQLIQATGKPAAAPAAPPPAPQP